MRSKPLIIIPIAVVSALLILFASDSIYLDKLCYDDGGKRVGDTCLVPITPSSTDNYQSPVAFLNAKTIKPNSALYFYYPPLKESEIKEPFRLFMLIRLPEWMGGGANDISAFRVYSAKSLDDSCLVKYWPEPERNRIENPCQGGMYRIIDGAETIGTTHRSSPMTALPHLDLSMDENGQLYVEPPQFTKTANGVVGIGREMTHDEIKEGSEFTVKSFAKSFPQFPSIPIEFAGFSLSEISPSSDYVYADYLDFQTLFRERVTLNIAKSPFKEITPNFLAPDSEFWQVGNTVIQISGSALEKNNDMPENYKTYLLEFTKDFFVYRLEGKNVEFLKKEIVSNYFPDYKYDDLILVSKTTD